MPKSTASKKSPAVKKSKSSTNTKSAYSKRVDERNTLYKDLSDCISGKPVELPPKFRTRVVKKKPERTTSINSKRKKPVEEIAASPAQSPAPSPQKTVKKTAKKTKISTAKPPSEQRTRSTRSTNRYWN